MLALASLPVDTDDVETRALAFDASAPICPNDNNFEDAGVAGEAGLKLQRPAFSLKTILFTNV
jgi:hypothetical protein